MNVVILVQKMTFVDEEEGMIPSPDQPFSFVCDRNLKGLNVGTNNEIIGDRRTSKECSKEKTTRYPLNTTRCLGTSEVPGHLNGTEGI